MLGGVRVNVGASKIRKGLWAPCWYTYNKDPHGIL